MVWFTQAYQAEVLEAAGEPSAAACVLLKQVHAVSADAEATEEVCSEGLGLFLLDGFLPCGVPAVEAFVPAVLEPVEVVPHLGAVDLLRSHRSYVKKDKALGSMNT